MEHDRPPRMLYGPTASFRFATTSPDFSPDGSSGCFFDSHGSIKTRPAQPVGVHRELRNRNARDSRELGQALPIVTEPLLEAVSYHKGDLTNVKREVKRKVDLFLGRGDD
jgi:hypothetical protein